MNEIWKPIPTYEGVYEVSNLGNVRSVERLRRVRDGIFAKVCLRILAQFVNKQGRMITHLSKNGVCKTYQVHRLVVWAFMGVQSTTKLHIHHKNGNCADNRLSNLELMLSSKHAAMHMYGTKQTTGSRNGQAKLTEAQVAEIRALYASGKYFQHDIAKMFGVARTIVSRIVGRKIWKHI